MKMSAVKGVARDNASQSNPLDSFLTPEAMMTPGAAGGITMVIATALSNNFGLPASKVGLALSFLCGLLVLANSRKIWVKSIYYVMNSLIIFCVAFGTNTLVTAKSSHHQASAQNNVFQLLIPTAFAQVSNSASLATLQQAQITLQAQYQDQVDKLATLKAGNAASAQISAQADVVQQLQVQMAANLAAQKNAVNAAQNPPANGTAANATYFKPWNSPF